MTKKKMRWRKRPLDKLLWLPLHHSRDQPTDIQSSTWCWASINVPDVGRMHYWSHCKGRERRSHSERGIAVLMLLEVWRYIFQMYRTCNASPMSAGCAHRLCRASNMSKLRIGEAVSLLWAFSFPTACHASWRQWWDMKSLSLRT